jgi:hypothetical protein
MKNIIAFNLKPIYQINKSGQIWSKYKNEWMNVREGKDGYMTLNLVTNDNKYRTCSVHRLVLATFSPTENIEMLQVNHKDGNKKNNHLSNLEWVTPQENIAHSWKMGLAHHIGESHGRAKITEEQAQVIIELLGEGKKQTEIMEIINCSKNTVCKIAQGRTWKHLPRQ